MIHIDPRDGAPIYRQIIDQVKRMVMTGALKPGDQLESVSNLASRVRINPMTVSKAYSSLVDAGVVERHRGVGLFVAKNGAATLRRERDQLLDSELRHVSALLVQMGVSKTEAAKLIAKHMTAIQKDIQGGLDDD